MLQRARNGSFTLHRPQPHTLFVHWRGLGDFLIAGRGRRITARPAPGACIGEFRDLLVTSIASAALLERGVETLHASSVVVAGSAVAFAGAAGCGKSTLAAFFARRGHLLLTDDLLPIHRHRQHVQAYPTLPEIKLEAGAVRGLGLNPRRLPLVVPGSSKHYWRVAGARGPRPLVALYFPRLSASPRGAVRLLPLSRAAAFRALLGCTFNTTLLTPARLRRQFALFARLATQVPARRLLIPHGWNRLDEAEERIQQDLLALRR